MPERSAKICSTVKRSPKNARGAKHATCVRGKLVEARLKNAEDRIGQRFVATRGAANELFEKECVALRACDERRDFQHRSRARRARRARTRSPRASRAATGEIDTIPRSDQRLGKSSDTSGAREREERRARARRRFRITESSTRTDGTSPQYKIFDHEDDGTRERRDPLFERGAKRVAHQPRVAARGAEHFDRLVGKSYAAHFSEERGLRSRDRTSRSCGWILRFACAACLRRRRS